MLQYYLDKIINLEHLTEDEAQGALGIIMDGRATDAQIGAFEIIGVNNRNLHTFHQSVETSY